MSLVVPFRALRPIKSFASQVAAPPYDVMSCEEAKRFVRENPLSFLHVEKSEIDVPDAGEDDQRIYDRAKTNLLGLVGKGVLRREEVPVFYLYRQRVGERFQTGIVAGVSIADYEAGRIRRHELTRPDKEQERMRHIDTVGAQTGPVMLTYRRREAIDRLAERVAARPPEYDFTAGDGVGHTVWVLSDPAEIRDVVEGFAPVESLYIADGHHRAAAAATVARLRKDKNQGNRGEEGYHILMSVLFPQEQLRIMDYNRAVRDLNGLTAEAFLDRAGQKFLISEGYAGKSPVRRHEFGMYLGGSWRHLAARKEILGDDDPVAGLDVSLLQEHLLGPVLGIRDPRTDSRISFIGGIRGMVELEKLVDGGAFAVAFSLYPPTVGEMITVADAGKVMPPKSTWFEPKLLSGLFVNLLE
ncbi:MAG: DUF1015 domain-containing protein [Syntrophus sp. (in: bacteria)]|nr:DUF1015 domain-containing protein [Syntrophus sp. (in: bacteria)]